MFEKMGFLDARITDIAARARVGHGTFYVYFETKDEILREVVLQAYAELLLPIKVPPRDPFVLIEDAVRHYLSVYQRNARLMVAWERVASLNDDFIALHREVRDTYAAWTERGIRRLQRQGRVDRGLDPRMASYALTGMVSEFAYRWFSDGRDYDLDTAVAQVSRLDANALGLTATDALRRAD